LLRAMRRARVPLTYSQGFNPKPRVQFGPALSVGVESFGEYLDFETTARLEVDAMRLAIDEALPRGFDVAALRQLERGVPGLGESICAARYLVVLPDGRTTADAAEAFARRDTLTVTREKNGKATAFPLATWMLTRPSWTTGNCASRCGSVGKGLRFASMRFSKASSERSKGGGGFAKISPSRSAAAW
jgi:radical SAM-linked protein